MDIISFAPFLLIFVIFYFLVFRPQSQERKAHAKMLSELKVGNEILLNNGIFGKIARIEPDNIKVEIAEGVKIKTLKNSVLKVI